MPMPATGLLQLYLWQGRMRVENLPVYIRRQMSTPPGPNRRAHTAVGGLPRPDHSGVAVPRTVAEARGTIC